MAPFFYEEELIVLLSVLTSAVPSFLMNVAVYVLTAAALYTIARRRGLDKPWMAWLPVVNNWILGSLSDQYQYLVKGAIKTKRKILLILSILSMVLGATIAVLGVVMATGIVMAGGNSGRITSMMGPAIGAIGLCLPLAGIAIAEMVISYMAKFDIYRSMDPSNSVLFLVLSILIPVTEPFFLFFNRNKELGMPPRKKQPEAPVREQSEPAQEPEEPESAQEPEQPQWYE